MEKIASTKVFKKTSANTILTLYLGSRDLISRNGIVEPLTGVIYIDPDFICNQKIYGQLTLTFRYGREDEEVMGLKFCNEAVIAIKQIWPKVKTNDTEVTPLQQALRERLGTGAHPFSLEVCTTAPPSVQLIPAKKYCGAPIGTSYDIRIYLSDVTDEKFFRQTTVKLGIRLLHKIPPDSRMIRQSSPTYSSLPKSIRLRLSPKQLKFHRNDKSLTTKSLSSINKASTMNFNCVSSTNTNHYNSKENITPKLLEVTTTTTFPTIASTTKSVDSDNQLFIDEKGKKYPSNGNGVLSGLTIKLPAVPPAAANVEMHAPISKCNNTSQSTSSSEFKPVPSKTLTNSFGDQKPLNENSIEKKASLLNEKMFTWVEGKVGLSATLNKSSYYHGETVTVNVDVKNNSKKIIRKVKVFAVQHVDVCMFSNGKFKNVIAEVTESHQIKQNENYNCVYNLKPLKGATKNWIAVEGSYSQDSSMLESPTKCLYKLASSVNRGPNLEDRNLFAIYVSYYVKVKLNLSGMGGDVALKLPFTLGYIENDDHRWRFNNSDSDVNSVSKFQILQCCCNKDENTSKNLVEQKTILDDEFNHKETATLSVVVEYKRNNKNVPKSSIQIAAHQDHNIPAEDDIVKSTICSNSLSSYKEGILKLSKSTEFEYSNKKYRKNIMCKSWDDYTNGFFKNLKIEEELNEKFEIDDFSNRNLSEDNPDNSLQIIKLKKENVEKLSKEKCILHNIKLKRSSYSKSCENIQTFSKLGNSIFMSSNISWHEKISDQSLVTQV